MNIVIEVKGAADSGTSALAQSIAMFLNKLDLSASTTLSVDLSNTDELQDLIDTIKERGTHIAISVSPIEDALSRNVLPLEPTDDELLGDEEDDIDGVDVEEPQAFDPQAFDAAEEDGTLNDNWTPPKGEPAADYTERSGRWLNRHERMAERDRADRVQDDSILD